MDVLIGQIVAAVGRCARADPREQRTARVTTEHNHLPIGDTAAAPAETADFVVTRSVGFPGTATSTYTSIGITPTASGHRSGESALG
ncbi:hypothetical protein [Nocardia sp. NPDC058633]|uniref:hypothetical protein n=1 Tax=Nocardia sp. NPDC058633 TaxID=3346568 RepID=UPI00365A7B11